ncbi:hypothetical protein [Acinetobacter sp. WCHA55]|uniref:hypothetical protein n=1 Tax=Acinetobacter sp. WCHA55 TaxID=2004646 RepID=UPI0013C2FC3A|nr:hypothetical protein [Acinetobacter sp. WCHA55]
MRINHKILIVMLLNGIFLQACDLSTDKTPKVEVEEKSSDFTPPMGPYGLPYRVGNFGGKPVNLGEGVSADYELCPVWEWSKAEPECKPRPKRNYDSVINFIAFEIRYTDETLLVTYVKAPQAKTLSKEYKIQKSLPDTPWVKVFAYAGNRYVKDGDMKGLLDRTVNNKPFTSSSGRLSYREVYKKTDQLNYGLEKYIPDPKWISKYGYEETDDLYVSVEKNKNEDISMINCSNHPLLQKCTLKFILEPELKVHVDASFSKKHLKDWKEIQQSVKAMILSFTVKEAVTSP